MSEAIMEEILAASCTKEAEDILTHELNEIYELGVAMGKRRTLQILESEIYKRK